MRLNLETTLNNHKLRNGFSHRNLETKKHIVMKFYAQINVMPLKALLDPQGKAVLNSAVKTGFETLRNVRIGKHIDVEIEAASEAEASKKIDEFCSKVLVNPIIESYEFTIAKVK